MEGTTFKYDLNKTNEASLVTKDMDNSNSKYK